MKTQREDFQLEALKGPLSVGGTNGLLWHDVVAQGVAAKNAPAWVSSGSERGSQTHPLPLRPLEPSLEKSGRLDKSTRDVSMTFKLQR